MFKNLLLLLYVYTFYLKVSSSTLSQAEIANWLNRAIDVEPLIYPSRFYYPVGRA